MQIVTFLQLLSSPYSFLFVASGALIIKSYILGFMFLQRQRIPLPFMPMMHIRWLLFVTIVGCSAFIDLSSVTKMLSITYVPTLDYHFVLLVLRLGWAMYILQRLLTVLFLKYMTDRDYSLTILDKLLILISSLVALYFTILAFTDFSASTAQARAAYMLTDPLEAKIMNYCVYFCDAITIIYTLRIMNSSSYAALPRILRFQVRTFALYFILPYAISTTVATLRIAFNLEISIGQVLGQNYYAIEIFTTMLITAALWYCVHRLISERFLGIGLRRYEPSDRQKL